MRAQYSSSKNERLAAYDQAEDERRTRDRSFDLVSRDNKGREVGADLSTVKGSVYQPRFTTESLQKSYHDKTDKMENFTKEVQKICTAALGAANIRHPPITSRIKSWESTKGSLHRRNHETFQRRRLRYLVESKGREWPEYAEETGISLDTEEPSEDPEDMLASLHDFSGIRISLYFPGDIEKVAAVLGERFEIDRKTDKGHGSQADGPSLQERIQSLEGDEKTKQPAAHFPKPKSVIRSFSGYRATHFIVRLSKAYLESINKPHWEHVVSEIQVGTLVMHVWSEIEHDMIYKPLESQDTEISEDEKRVLDLINGIVLTGEAALRQLEASTANRLNRRAEDENAIMSSHYELAIWIEKYFEARGVSLEGLGSEWGPLEKVFVILKTAGQLRHSQVTTLIEFAARNTSNRRKIPEEMLWGLCSQITRHQWDKPSDSTIPDIGEKARLCGLHLVHSINLAIYFDVIDEYLRLAPFTCQVSLEAFLDILHPEKGRYDAETAEKIIECCKSVYDFQFSATLPRVAAHLPTKNMIGIFARTDIVRTAPIPGIIARFFPVDTRDNRAHDTESKLYRTLDFVDSYLAHKNKVDTTIFWDHLTARNPTSDRFFIATQSHPDLLFGHWRLDHSAQLDIEKIHPDDFKTTTEFSYRNTVPLAQSGFLEFAFHLYPVKQHDDLEKAWKLSKILRKPPPKLPPRKPRQKYYEPRSLPGTIPTQVEFVTETFEMS